MFVTRQSEICSKEPEATFFQCDPPGKDVLVSKSALTPKAAAERQIDPKFCVSSMLSMAKIVARSGSLAKVSCNAGKGFAKQTRAIP